MLQRWPNIFSGLIIIGLPFLGLGISFPATFSATSGFQLARLMAGCWYFWPSIRNLGSIRHNKLFDNTSKRSNRSVENLLSQLQFKSNLNVAKYYLTLVGFDINIGLHHHRSRAASSVVQGSHKKNVPTSGNFLSPPPVPLDNEAFFLIWEKLETSWS